MKMGSDDYGLRSFHTTPEKKAGNEKKSESTEPPARDNSDSYDWWYKKQGIDLLNVGEAIKDKLPLVSGSLEQCEEYAKQNKYESLGKLNNPNANGTKLRKKEGNLAIMLQKGDSWGVYSCIYFPEKSVAEKDNKKEKEETNEDTFNEEFKI
jgi:hypothetical protein